MAYLNGIQCGMTNYEWECVRGVFESRMTRIFREVFEVFEVCGVAWEKINH